MTAGTSVAKQMIWKDVQLHRFQIASTIVCGVAALALLFAKREPFSVVGSVALFIALIYIGCLLPSTNILNERKKQTLPFMISLPISTMQYTTAKLASTVGIFMIPWLTFVIAAFWLIGVQSVFPHGAIPMALILLMLPFLGTCIITAMTLVGEAEGWFMTANVLCNSSYGLTWYFLIRTPSLAHDLTGNHAVWNSAVLTFLFSEFAAIVAILALTYFLQSRKRDFV
jgi:ABC-2 type transport system permease protein